MKNTTIDYFTHPLCMESKHFDEIVKRLAYEFRDSAAWNYRMVLPWDCAKYAGGNFNSTYELAALAARTALLQGKDAYLRFAEGCRQHPDLGHTMFSMLRIADDVASDDVFDSRLFRKHLSTRSGVNELHEDLILARKNGVVRSPSLVIRQDDQTILISGLKDYGTLDQKFRYVFPERKIA